MNKDLKLENFYSLDFLQMAKTALAKANQRLNISPFEFEDYPLGIFQEKLRQAFNLSQEVNLFKVPTKEEGEVALNLFELQRLKLEEKEIAKVLQDQNYIEKFTFSKHFLNLTLTKKFLFETLNSILAKDCESFGSFNLGRKKLILVEFSSPNIAKPLGVSHLRSTFLGNSLANLAQELSFKVLRVNFLGDWGSQFKKLYLAFKLWGKELNLPALKDLYVRFHLEEEKDPSLKEKLNSISEKEFLGFWQKVKELSLREFMNFYQLFSISFDLFDGESYHQNLAQALVDLALKLKIVEEKEGAVLVKKLNSLPSFLLAKKGKETLYLTRDLASLAFRVNFFKPDFIFYVVGKEQELHFKQLFSLADRLDLSKNVSLEHVAFGLFLTKEGKKMSTRKGTLVLAQDLMEKVLQATQTTFYPHLDVKTEEVLSLAKGIIVHTFLRYSREKPVVFDLSKALSLKGNSAPYLQYTLARMNSILNKEEPYQLTFEFKEIKKVSSLEKELASIISWYPLALKLSLEKRDTFYLVDYLQELAQRFNSFYEKVPILKEEDKELKSVRLKLTAILSKIMVKGLNILGIPVVDKL